MSKFIELTQLNFQKEYKLLFITLYRKPTTFGKVTVEASKITSFGKVRPKSDSMYFRSDYPTFTTVDLVGRKSLDVIETPEEIRKLIER